MQLEKLPYMVGDFAALRLHHNTWYQKVAFEVIEKEQIKLFKVSDYFLRPRLDKRS